MALLCRPLREEKIIFMLFEARSARTGWSVLTLGSTSKLPSISSNTYCLFAQISWGSILWEAHLWTRINSEAYAGQKNRRKNEKVKLLTNLPMTEGKFRSGSALSDHPALVDEVPRSTTTLVDLSGGSGVIALAISTSFIISRCAGWWKLTSLPQNYRAKQHWLTLTACLRFPLLNRDNFEHWK